MKYTTFAHIIFLIIIGFSLWFGFMVYKQKYKN
jgi:hypothetical protein